MNKNLNYGIFAGTLLSGLIPLLALAEDCTDLGTGFYENPISSALKVCTLPGLINALVDLVLLVGVPIVAIFIIYGGFLFVKAGDNESEITKAKTVLTWTLVGALVLFGAKAISLAIQGTINSLGG